MSTSWAHTFYDEHIAYLLRRDIDGLVDRHYREDAVLIGFDVTVRGRAALKEYLHAYLQRLGQFSVKSTDRFTATQDAILFEATVSSDLGEARVYDAFVLRDGQISHHFTGVIT